MHSLPLFIRLQGRSVILIGDGDAADAKRRLLARAGAVISDDPDAADAVLAIVAIEDEADSVAMAARLKARGLLVNVVDRPALCDFTTPAIVDRDPVLIAIGTGGASAGLAKALRQRFDALLPANLGAVASGLAAARDALRTRWTDGAARRRAIDAALQPAGALDPFVAHDPGAVDAWLDQPDAKPVAGVHIITLASSDPDDLMLRTARLLGMADVVVHDAAVPDAILNRARADAVRILGSAVPGGVDATALVVILSLAQEGGV